jgi:hypothetical protein
MLATTKSGPSGARSGSQTYSPDFRVTVSGETRTLSVKLSAKMKHRSRMNRTVTIATKYENKRFMAISVQFTIALDASNRPRLSIL